MGTGKVLGAAELQAVWQCSTSPPIEAYQPDITRGTTIATARPVPPIKPDKPAPKIVNAKPVAT